MKSRNERLARLLRDKFRSDPDGFREYLPGAAELLSEQVPTRRRFGSPFGLTENELTHNRGELADILRKLTEGTLTTEAAWTGLRHCAVLTKNGNLPYGWDENLSHEMNYEVLKNLLWKALGKSPGSYKRKTVVPTGQGTTEPVAEQVPIIKGIHLDLDINRRLVSISVNPGKYKERNKLVSIIGLCFESKQDGAPVSPKATRL